MEAETLSDGWVRYFDENSKCFYFFNESTGTTQWDEPPSIKTANLTSDPISQTDAENTLCDQASLPAYMQTDFSKLGHNDDNYSDMDDAECPHSDMDSDEDSRKEYDQWREQLVRENYLLPDAWHEDRSAAVLKSRPTEEIIRGGTNQDYVGLARIYKIQRPYSHPTARLVCVLCHKRDAEDVFFPCEHRCVCRKCIRNEKVVEESKFDEMSADGFCNCPLCATIIKKILPSEGGAEIETYWRWVLEVAPPISKSFLKNFKHSAGVLRTVYNIDCEDEEEDRTDATGVCSVS